MIQDLNFRTMSLLRSRQIVFNSCVNSRAGFLWYPVSSSRVLDSHCGSKYGQIDPKRSLSRTSVVTLKSAISREIARKVHLKDEMPPDYEIVYKGNLSNYIYFGRISCCILTTAVVVSAGMGTFHPYQELFLGSEYWHIQSWECMSFCAMAFLHLLSIHYVVERHPLRIYYSDKRDNFVIVFSHFLPWKVKKMDCASGGMDKARPAFIDKWIGSGGYIIENKNKMFLHQRSFSNVYFYRKLMGFYDESLYDDE